MRRMNRLATKTIRSNHKALFNVFFSHDFIETRFLRIYLDLRTWMESVSSEASMYGKGLYAHLVKL